RPAAFSRSNPALAWSAEGWACSDNGDPTASTFNRNGKEVHPWPASSGPSHRAGSDAITSARVRPVGSSTTREGAAGCVPTQSSASGPPDGGDPTMAARPFVRPHEYGRTELRR